MNRTELTDALTCAIDLIELIEVNGDMIEVNQEKWCARVNLSFPSTPEVKCAELYINLVAEMVEYQAIRCTVWNLAHALDHLMADEGTRH